MKKNLILTNLILVTFFLSCSTEEAGIEDTSNNTNNNYIDSSRSISSYTLLYPSGASFTHAFENEKETTTTTHSGYVNNEFIYSDDQMTEVNSYYWPTGNLESNYAFNYENDRLTSIEVEDNSNFAASEYTMNFNYDDNESTITITLDIDSFYLTEYKLKFLDNNYNLITEFYEEQYHLNYDNTRDIDSYVIEQFTYDSNLNCIKLIRTDSWSSNYPATTTEFNYSYDNYTNPLYNYYSNYYLQSIILRGVRDNIFSAGLYQFIETFGKNNIDEIDYPNTYSIYSTYTFENYYENGVITKLETTSDYTNQITATTTFNY